MQTESSWAGLRFALSSGFSGGNVGQGDYLDAIFAYNGKPVYGYNQKIELDWQLPLDLKLADTEEVLQYIKNDMVRMITIRTSNAHSEQTKTSMFYIFNQNNKTWVKKTFNGDSLRPRAFGHWIAFEERFVNGLPLAYSNDGSVIATNLFHLTAAERFNYFGVSQTGVLNIYDTANDKLITFDTAQPDSEVLWVGNDQVYYRVGDEIRLAKINGSALDQAQVLVKDHAVLAIHWLFLGKD